MGVNLMSIRLFHSIILVSFAMQLVFDNISAKSERIQKTNAHYAASLEIPTCISDMYGGCGRNHSLSVRKFKKHARSPRRIFENLTKFLNVLRHPKSKYVKRNVEPTDDHVVKCLQRSDDTITCFSKGKFYQFKGEEKDSVKQAAINIKRRRFCSNCTPNRNFFGSAASKTRLLTRKLSRINHVSSIYGNSVPYQEVMMEPSSRKSRPLSCYGFVAPPTNGIFSKKASSRVRMDSQLMNSVPKSGVNSSRYKDAYPHGGICSSNVLLNRKIMPSDSDHMRSSGLGYHKSSRPTHLIEKRSQIVSVACRPLYIPTAKPSVNEGRVPQCRIPCGAHNCAPFPTCPCRPSCRTPAPPQTTCPQIPGLAESEATLTQPTRCPPYEFTDEPCPTFECKDGCPYLTTPGCPCAAPARINKGLQRKGQSLSDVSKVSSKWRMKNVPRSSPTKLSKNRMITTRTRPPTAPTGLTRNTSMMEKKIIDEYPARNTSAVLSYSNVTEKSRMGSLMRSNGSQKVDLVFGSKVPDLLSNFDFKKLLKSAKSHYRERMELNPRNYRNEVPIN